MDKLIDRLCKLLAVKSIMTITLTVVFAWLSLQGAVTPAQFVTVFTVIVGFYFGTQSEKDKREKEVNHDQDPGGAVQD